MKRIVIAAAIASIALIGLRGAARHCRQLCADRSATSCGDAHCNDATNNAVPETGTNANPEQ